MIRPPVVEDNLLRVTGTGKINRALVGLSWVLLFGGRVKRLLRVFQVRVRR